MNFYADLQRVATGTDLMWTLRHGDRSNLKNKHVAYRVRWDRDTERGGTIRSVSLHCVCMASGEVYHHDDITSMREMGHGD